MGQRLQDRKIVLVAFSSDDARARVARAVAERLPGATIFTASEGSEAWMKIENMPPHVVVLERALAKLDGLQLLKNILENKKYEQTSAVFFDTPPDNQLLVDEVVTGRVQFLGARVEDGRFGRALAKALNDVASREDTEFQMRFLAAGERLLQRGDRSRHVYLVRRGRLKAVRGDEGTEVVLGEIETGEFVGEMAYINDEPRNADVLALTDCELIEIPAEHLDHELYRKPSWAKALMVTLSKRVKKANDLSRPRA